MQEVIKREDLEKIVNLFNIKEKEVNYHNDKLTIVSNQESDNDSFIKEVEKNCKVNNEAKLLTVIDEINIENSLVQLIFVNLKVLINLRYNNIFKVFYSTFHQISKDNDILNTFAKCKLYLKFCNFDNNTSCSCFLLNNSSSCYCENCTFNNYCNITLNDNCFALIKDCKFVNIKQNCFNIKNKSTIVLVNCEFNNYDSIDKFIICNNNSCVKFVNCSFNNVSSSIIINSKSKIVSEDSLFKDFNNSSIIIKDKSIVEIDSCKFDTINGNALLLINSTGVIINSSFINTSYPSLSIRGLYSNPVIKDCKFLKNTLSCFIAIRNLSRPLLENCFIDTLFSYSIHCSDLSMPVIKGLQYDKAANSCKIIVSDYSRLYLDCNQDIITTKSNGKKFDSLIKLENYGSLVAKKSFTIKDEINCYTLLINNNSLSSFDLKDFKEIFAKRLQLQNINKLTIDNYCIKDFKEDNGKSKMMKDNDEKIMINLPCGHFCNNKLDQSVSNCSKYCEICDIKIKSKVALFDKELSCAICKSKDIASYLVPCGHQCFCSSCSLHFLDKFKNCPVCNKLITQVRFY